MQPQAMDQPRTPLLEARGIAKHYGSVVALESADFEVYAGEIVALIGDNATSAEGGRGVRLKTPGSPTAPNERDAK